MQKARKLKELKEQGNEAFNSSKLTEAFSLYTEALKIDPNNISTNSKLYNNRATVSYKVSASVVINEIFICFTISENIDLKKLWFYIL